MKIMQQLLTIEFLLILMMLPYKSCWTESEVSDERDIDAKWLAYKVKSKYLLHLSSIIE